MSNPKFTNELIKETSPYLLQHAHNPVHWKPWKTKVLETAKSQNKLLLISIGYATCHWCHVMEKECFENEAVAEVMNNHFVNIKVDREERPDIDQVYMNALQLMTGSGGWPLNIVALPDGKPVWGATYVHKDEWEAVLTQLYKLYKSQPQTLVEYAEKLEQGIKATDVVALNAETIDFSSFGYSETLAFWSRQFDWEFGGTKRPPKFMMPNNYHFLLRYGFQTKDKSLLDFVHLTLTKMAYGGIFDHVNGGFSRYSIDEKWHVPHFEKMLYDNAQLVSLYSDAFVQSKNSLYKEVVYDTLAFVKRELTDATGGFYSALDADSINEYGIAEEGAYYVFTKAELKEQLRDDFSLFAAYYNVNPYGKWEKNNYILIRNISDEDFCSQHQITESFFSEKKKKWKQLLLEHRKIKARPGLDHKILTAWNALMIKGYVDAYRVFNDPGFLESAMACADFICKNLMREDGSLYRNFTKGIAGVTGFLDDYANLCAAFIALYENTFDEKWLSLSKKMITYCFAHFYDDKTSMFYYASDKNEALIAKTIEFRDNVIPASNSVMAKNLHWLGSFFDEKKYKETALQMLKNILPEIEHHPPGYSNWLDLLLSFTHPFYEVVVVGKNALVKRKGLGNHYLPGILIAGSTAASHLPLLKNRFKANETLFYVCEKGSCKLPVQSIDEVLNLVQK